MKTIAKPDAGEYAPYTISYIGLLPDDGLILKHLQDNLTVTSNFLRSLSEERLSYRYAEGKWTIKEILAHLIDDERIYSYRACVLRAMTRLNCQALNRMTMLWSRVPMSGALKTCCKSLRRSEQQLSHCLTVSIVQHY